LNKRDVMATLEMILNEAHTAVLATVDDQGRPHLRWMTPALIGGREGAVFAVTSPGFDKTRQLEKHPEVEWLFQTPLLDTVVIARGKINVLDNPSIKAEVLESLGPYMHSFWRLQGEAREMVVLETIIEEAVCYWPLKGRKEVVSEW
jgi:general stress protein 26